MSSYLASIRKLMAQDGLDVLYVDSQDAHASEYVCESDSRRAFISNFTGSAGTAVILLDTALLWTDGRYHLQAANELSNEWTLMKAGLPEVPDIATWLTKNLKSGSKVGVDAFTISSKQADSLKDKLNEVGIELVPTEGNLVDKVWDTRPAYPCTPVEVVPVARAGASIEQKFNNIKTFLESNNAEALLVTALDEIAWLLNIRGHDVEFNPVSISYAIVTLKGIEWFVDSNKIQTEEVREHLKDLVQIFPYDSVEDRLKELAACSKIVVDTTTSNWRLARVVGESLIAKTSPIILSKAVKTNEEIYGFINSHIRDGVALTAFIHFLEQKVTQNPNSITEFEAAMELEKFRTKMPLHVGPSFPTIAGYAANGAIIHYRPEEKSAAPIGIEGTFLLDSGAQYRDGTTDVTRTLHFGEPDEHTKTTYTAVLKGHIAIASLVFPNNYQGSRLDAFARSALWAHGLDYLHGTGHGVGCYLNVHEGPQQISFRSREGEQGFQKNMTISNEPGYYENGVLGIRIENILYSTEADTKFNKGKYLKFENLTLVPISRKLIDISLLSDSDIEYLNNYHAKVQEKLLPLMNEYFPESVDYLLQETSPLSR